MDENDRRSGARPDSDAWGVLLGPENGRILVINCIRLLPAGILNAPDRTVIHSSYAAVDRSLIDRARPEVVVAPLFGEEFDVIDLIQRLEGVGFAGSVVALAARMPNIASVEREIQSTSKTIRVRILAVPDAPEAGT